MRGVVFGEFNNWCVLILIDNIFLNDFIMGCVFFGYELCGIFMENIESVMVIWFLVGVLYGNNVMFGVIKIKIKVVRKGFGVFIDVGSFGKYDVGLFLG